MFNQGLQSHAYKVTPTKIPISGSPGQEPTVQGTKRICEVSETHLPREDGTKLIFLIRSRENTGCGNLAGPTRNLVHNLEKAIPRWTLDRLTCENTHLSLVIWGKRLLSHIVNLQRCPFRCDEHDFDLTGTQDKLSTPPHTGLALLFLVEVHVCTCSHRASWLAKMNFSARNCDYKNIPDANSRCSVN